MPLWESCTVVLVNLLFCLKELCFLGVKFFKTGIWLTSFFSELLYSSSRTRLTAAYLSSKSVWRHIIIFLNQSFIWKQKCSQSDFMACFHILAWYIVLEKMSLIRSSILNITPDFIFHLWFYCFSPCLLSLTHLLHVFNPHLKPFIVSCPVVLQVLLWGLCAYTAPSEDCPCRV